MAVNKYSVGRQWFILFPKNAPQQKTFWHAKEKIEKLKDLDDVL
jgi:hypothetical protein